MDVQLLIISQNMSMEQLAFMQQASGSQLTVIQNLYAHSLTKWRVRLHLLTAQQD
jgi:hypothetical protein